MSYNAQYGMSGPGQTFNAAASSSPWYGQANDWATIISGIGQAASSAMNTPTAAPFAVNKRESREAKRRTLSNTLNAALKRDQALSRLGQQHADDMNDYQAQAMQQIARGFVGALQGSTG